MNAPITIHYDRRIVRTAVLTFWRRKVGVGFFVALAVVAAGVAFSIFEGERGWFVGASGTVVLLGIVFVGAVFLSHYRAAMGRLRAMEPAEAKLTLSREGFTLSSSIGSSTLRWSAVRELWETPQFWLLFLSSAQFITLPTADIPSDALATIRSSVVASGAKVA